MNKENQQKLIRFFLVLLFALFVINFATTLSKTVNNDEKANINYTSFVADVNAGKIKEVVVLENSSGPLELKVTPNTGKGFVINAPAKDGERLMADLIKNKVAIKSVAEEGDGWFAAFFFSWGPVILLIAAFVWLHRKSSGGKSGLFSFNKSKAQLVNPDKLTVTFNDVVGCDEAKRDAQEFVDFLKNPDKFSKLGGRIPRGLLLTGPAGTGKTMLAKALAKESGVPFYFVSGSEFVEMFVGVGAGRVRDMFETAKKVAPCVLFIDEIDAIGGKRGGGGMSGSNDEREQTLNQILVELDGMDTHKGVILVAATNRPEILDKALLRPGRIDRQIVVGLPDVNGREQILKIHSKEVPMVNDVDLSRIARGTPGFSGAELHNLVNEAAILAARAGKVFVEQQDFEEAKDNIMMGVQRPSLAMTDADKRDTAYHESGHAVIAKLLPGADPVHKVSIIPRGRALGVTMQLPEQDRWSYKKQYLLDRIAILMGGRVAEELFCHTMTNGASNDIMVATNTAGSMVREWGMSELGPVAFGDRESSFLGAGQINTSYLSEGTKRDVDAEISRMVNSEYQRAKNLLEQHSDKVEAMTNALMEVETLDDWQIENIMQGRHFNDNLGLMEMKEQVAEKDRLFRERRDKLDKKRGEYVAPVVPLTKTDE